MNDLNPKALYSLALLTLIGLALDGPGGGLTGALAAVTAIVYTTVTQRHLSIYQWRRPIGVKVAYVLGIVAILANAFSLRYHGLIFTSF